MKHIRLLALAIIGSNIFCNVLPTEPEQTEVKTSYSQLTNNLQALLSDYRGKQFKRNVTPVVYTRAEYINNRDRVKDQVTEKKQSEINEVLRFQGFIGQDDDFFDGYDEMLDNVVGGSYEFGTDTILIVIEDDEDDISRKDSLTMFHELTHALQDQYYNLKSLRNEVQSSDQSYALRYTLEGEADLLELCYFYYVSEGYFPVSNTPLYEFYDYYALEVEDYLDSLHNAGEILYAYQPMLWAYYSYGPRFILHEIEGTKFEQIDTKIFQSLPVKTREVMHPDIYNTGSRSGYNISFDFMEELDDTFIIYDYDEVGEMLMSVLLREWDVEKYKQYAEGLLADRIIVFGGANTDSLRLIWYTYWESDSKANTFYNVYDDILAKKRSETLPASVGTNMSSLTVTTDNVYIEQNNQKVFIVEHLNDAAFDDWLSKVHAIEPNKKLLAKKKRSDHKQYPFIDKSPLVDELRICR